MYCRTFAPRLVRYREWLTSLDNGSCKVISVHELKLLLQVWVAQLRPWRHCSWKSADSGWGGNCLCVHRGKPGASCERRPLAAAGWDQSGTSWGKHHLPSNALCWCVCWVYWCASCALCYVLHKSELCKSPNSLSTASMFFLADAGMDMSAESLFQNWCFTPCSWPALVNTALAGLRTLRVIL